MEAAAAPVGEERAFCNAFEEEKGELEALAEPLLLLLGDLEERRLIVELASLVGGVGGGSLLLGICKVLRSSGDERVSLLP